MAQAVLIDLIHSWNCITGTNNLFQHGATAFKIAFYPCKIIHTLHTPPRCILIMMKVYRAIKWIVPAVWWRHFSPFTMCHLNVAFWGRKKLWQRHKRRPYMAYIIHSSPLLQWLSNRGKGRMGMATPEGIWITKDRIGLHRYTLHEILWLDYIWLKLSLIQSNIGTLLCRLYTVPTIYTVGLHALMQQQYESLQ